ncbi:11541_t:CDS:2 [Scutellospora calospora]|uniref:11541_t:CDS:1 n=1 Tax=Scutellospora calospora TaxID=85575 RepID=A0ACA9LZK8_9GLOM|nr:11541_t:CDS:2 [Scutellospora calospora]
MGNMNKTSLSFDMPSNVTIDDKGNKTISIRTYGYEKFCFTIVLACLADSTKLPPIIIFKLKNILRLEFLSEWIKHAWDDIDTLLIKNSFKYCSILVANNSSEEDLIFDYDHIENNNNEVNEYIFNSKT